MPVYNSNKLYNYLKEKDGEINIVDVRKFEAENYQYDAGTLNFVGANRSLKYFLFRKTNQEKSE